MEYPFKDLMPLDEVLEREGYYKDWTHLDPEVFYSLTQISNFIKTKGFGVDVRLLIAQLAEHFGLKTTQVVDLANLLQQKFTNLEGVTQSFTNNINSLVAQMEADKDAVIANATVDSEVILARGGKPTLQARLDETTTQLAQTTNMVGVSIESFPRLAHEVDDSGRIQRAVDYIEGLAPNNMHSWAFMQSKTLVIPEGVHTASGIVISKPIQIVGSSAVTSIIKSNGSDMPIFTVKGHLISESPTLVEDIKTTFSRVGIIGTEPSGYNNPFVKTNQIGIKLDNTDPLRVKARVEVHFCNIRHCGSHGIELGTSVSNRITNNNISLNSGDGIRMTGVYNTDIRITNNSIRRNRTGVNIEPSTGSFITTGLINDNLIESNLNGTGGAGSATRPAVGLKMLRVQGITIENNYFEHHLNDVYGLSAVSLNTFKNNYHDSNSNNIPKNADYLPIARQVAPYYFDGTENINISDTIEANRLYKPTKPTDVSDAAWGTNIWGATYEHLPKLGTQTIIRHNIDRNPITGQLAEILYKGQGNEVYEGASEISGGIFEKKTKAQKITRKASFEFHDYSRVYNHESDTTVSYDIPSEVYIHPEVLNVPFKRIFSGRERKLDGTLTPKVDAFGINGNYELAIPVGKPLAYQYAAGDYFARHFAGSGAPTTGTYGAGDIIWNRLPAAGGYIGWSCITAGSPGIWKGFGTIAS